MGVEQIRSKIVEEVLPRGVDRLAKIIDDEHAKANDQIKAFQTLADRGGLYAISGTFSQHAEVQLDMEQLADMRRSLVEEKERTDQQIKHLQEQLSKERIESVKKEATKALPRPDEAEEIAQRR